LAGRILDDRCALRLIAGPARERDDQNRYKPNRCECE
jgi:hypothetical protein